jgi:hypothetical protein
MPSLLTPTPNLQRIRTYNGRQAHDGTSCTAALKMTNDLKNIIIIIISS